jgi:integrase/recombinase XerD
MNTPPQTNQPIPKEIIAFIIDRTARQLSPRTIKYYTDELGWFSAWLAHQQPPITHIQQITADLIRQYQIHLSATRNPGGIHAAWRAIKAFLNWYTIELDDDTYRNPIRKVHPPKINQDPLPGIPIDHIKALLAACNPKTTPGKRDKAIITFLFDTGIRKEELVNLTIADINLKTGAVQIIHGKGNKNRTVYLGASARRELIRYLRTRPETPPTAPLFLNQAKTRLTGAGLRQIIRRRAAEANIPEPGLHDFRRAFAIQSLRNGIDLITLMHLMGHTDTKVLQRYLKLVERDLQRGHEKSSPADAL